VRPRKTPKRVSPNTTGPHPVIPKRLIAERVKRVLVVLVKTKSLLILNKEAHSSKGKPQKKISQKDDTVKRGLFTDIVVFKTTGPFLGILV
jgi:hypothetical protein